ncbi:MAG TPA: peptidylprolyl isomerase, partial [Gemmatimonadaceae bacterium]|nr:peptidylprolyl isomerase [Gemmatimonadaceae bacterium]
YADSTAVAALGSALDSPDSWLSVSAAEGLGGLKSPAVTPRLIAAAKAGHPCALRLTAMQQLQMYARADAITAAISITTDSSAYCRVTALQTLTRLVPAPADGTPPRVAIENAMDDTVEAVRLQARAANWAALDAEMDVDGRRETRRNDLDSPDVATRAAAMRGVSAWADTSDLPSLLALYDRERQQSNPIVASEAATAIAAVQRRQGAGAKEFFARFKPPDNPTLRRDVDRAFGQAAREAWPAAAPTKRSLADYKQIVERWVVPAFSGKPDPTAEWVTPRGTIDLELYAGDAPLAVDDFVRTMASGALVGVEFTRVVPDFVDQQRTITDGNVLRDEVNRRGLTRGNLSWASRGLDTGSPGYTLGNTPQPHNEGDFTSLGRVVEGMDVMDHIQLGDQITAAKMLTGGTVH